MPRSDVSIEIPLRGCQHSYLTTHLGVCILASMNRRAKSAAVRAHVRTAINAYVRSMTSRGGKARAKALTPERRSEIARAAVQARWRKAKS